MGKGARPPVRLWSHRRALTHSRECKAGVALNVGGLKKARDSEPSFLGFVLVDGWTQVLILALDLDAVHALSTPLLIALALPRPQPGLHFLRLQCRRDPWQHRASAGQKTHEMG